MILTLSLTFQAYKFNAHNITHVRRASNAALGLHFFNKPIRAYKATIGAFEFQDH